MTDKTNRSALPARRLLSTAGRLGALALLALLAGCSVGQPLAFIPDFPFSFNVAEVNPEWPVNIEVRDGTQMGLAQ